MTKNELRSRNNVATDPRHIKEVIDEILRSNSLFKDVFPNTELGIDLKLLTLNAGRLDLGVAIQGTIVHDDEYHYTFIEEAHTEETPDTTEAEIKYAPMSVAPDTSVPTAPEAFEKKGTPVKRNPIVIPGNCVNLHRKDDGSLTLAFCRPVLTEHYTWKNYCIEAAQEILSLASLVEEERPMART